MANPTWGFTRSQVSNPISNFDASDSEVFTLYEVWTEQFQAVLIEGT
jgi:hypothetical protein